MTNQSSAMLIKTDMRNCVYTYPTILTRFSLIITFGR